MEAGVLVLLAGYVADLDVFVLWDANAHSDFAYSKGIQVGESTVHHTALRGVAMQRRGVRASSGKYDEYVVAARADYLIEGVRQRQYFTRRSLLGQEIPDEDLMIP
jgi:hypothetical protein